MASSHPKRVTLCCLLCFGLPALSGCFAPPADGSSERIARLRQDKLELQDEVARLTGETDRLQGQLETLKGLPREVDKGFPYQLQGVTLSKYTGLYDQDGDHVPETLLVYLKPIDQEGDIVKAAGQVDVQLWNLDGSSEAAMIGQWQVDPMSLREMWYASLLTINYRLEFELPRAAATVETPLTVKVRFSDMLSGKVFSEQRVAPRHVY